MIISVTQACNLRCKGCYAQAMHRPAEPELEDARLAGVVDEAQALGIAIILLAGGEPLTRPALLDITARHPGIIFPLFTNGLLIDAPLAQTLAHQPHVVPVVSLEGLQAETDARRGLGTFNGTGRAMAHLQQAGVYFGASVTVTTQNLDTVTGEAFIRRLNRAGCRLFFFIDYVPVEPGSEALVLSTAQRLEMAGRIERLHRRVPGLYVSFPGDEERFGGCLAAGRGFVHVSAQGRLEPCPFSPYADTTLADTPLREALKSRLLRKIRENPEHLGELSGGCALWQRRDWVKGLADESR
jgi:MoaA/NifB/PqqE/SkfB family radical SAM enzyme